MSSRETLKSILPEPPEERTLGTWRERIDLVDRLILALLNDRAISANEIGRIKKASGLPVYVPSREQQVIDNVLASNEGPLPDRAVQHLFERIIDEIRSLERRHYQDEPDADQGRSPGD
ncbi:MAG: chorismate mutase [Rhodothermales bacterium]|nr:chorismate mutase [Rhodothermales bacterium]MBO6780373.1 chorismate mutase [Rhodothermales bacterium]